MEAAAKIKLVEELTEAETGDGLLPQSRIDELCSVLYEFLGGQITLADTKAQLTLAADALMATVIFSIDRSVFLSIFDGSENIFKRLGALALVGMLGALLMSIYYSMRVARPTLPPMKQPNMFYFVDVSRLDEATFRTKFLTQTADTVTHALLEEVYLLSKIAYRKFDRVRLSINWLVVTFITFLIAEVFLILGG